MSGNENLPSLVEFVILFQDQHMVCTVDTPKVQSVIDELTKAIKEWTFNKDRIMVAIDGVNGPCYVFAPYIFGFYLRPAHKDTIDVYQKKILEMMERQVKAAEKCAGEVDKGEDWKE